MVLLTRVSKFNMRATALLLQQPPLFRITHADLGAARKCQPCKGYAVL